MNWLAHLVLSEPNPAFRVGNVLADLLSITDLRQLPGEFQPGIVRHREIDSFTDKHPVFKRSVARFDPRFRRFGPVIMDIFYDHFLSVSWPHLQTTPLPAFVDQFHRDVEICGSMIPPQTYALLRRMRSANWLTSYGEIDGVRLTLDRMSLRLKRPFNLAEATDELVLHHDDFAQDFAEFFPQIQTRFGATT